MNNGWMDRDGLKDSDWKGRNGKDVGGQIFCSIIGAILIMFLVTLIVVPLAPIIPELWALFGFVGIPIAALFIGLIVCAINTFINNL